MVVVTIVYFRKLQYYLKYYSFTAVYFSRFLPGIRCARKLKKYCADFYSRVVHVG